MTERPRTSKSLTKIIAIRKLQTDTARAQLAAAKSAQAQQKKAWEDSRALLEACAHDWAGYLQEPAPDPHHLAYYAGRTTIAEQAQTAAQNKYTLSKHACVIRAEALQSANATLKASQEIKAKYEQRKQRRALSAQADAAIANFLLGQAKQ